MNNRATELFEKEKLFRHQGRFSGEYPLNCLLRVLKDAGFTVTGQTGSHIHLYHPKLVGWEEAPSGRMTIVRKHPGSKNKPMTPYYGVQAAFRAVSFLIETGGYPNE